MIKLPRLFCWIGSLIKICPKNYSNLFSMILSVNLYCPSLHFIGESLIKANVVIIVSEQDEAGMNIAEFIRENCPLENASNVKIPPNWPLGNYQIQYNAENTIALFTMSPYHFQADFLCVRLTSVLL